MKRKIVLDIIIEECPDGDDSIEGKIYYPDEGGKIYIRKNKNRLEFNHTFFHEVAHLFDWLLGTDMNNTSKKEKEAFAWEIGVEMEEHFKRFYNKNIIKKDES